MQGKLDKNCTKSISEVEYRQGLLLCGGISFIGWALIFMSSWSSLYLIYPGMVLVGWSCGLSCPLSSIYVSELAGRGNKGMVTSIFNLNLTTGILFANVLGVMVE
jgi:MFS family permease